MYTKTDSLKQCSYRFQKYQNNISIYCNTNYINPISRVCKYRYINNDKQHEESSKEDTFSKYIQVFYQDDFHNKFIAYQNPHQSLTNKSQNFQNNCKINDEDNFQTNFLLPYLKNQDKQSTQVSPKEILESVSHYLNEIRPQFGNILNADNEIMFINLKVKRGCKIKFAQQFLNRAQQSKCSNNKSCTQLSQNQDVSHNKQHSDESSEKQTANEQEDLHFDKSDCVSSRFQKNESPLNTESEDLIQNNEEKIIKKGKNQKKYVQSQYHNLKNSFMQLVTQLFCSDILSCFEFSKLRLLSAEQIIKRMKNNSIKYRPIKGKYQYYSSPHYITLFQKFTEENFMELKQNPVLYTLHQLFFLEDIQLCSSVTELPIIKCNYYKLLIGQIVIKFLDVSEVELQNNVQIHSSSQQIPSTYNRYLYINKVKKGIYKLQKGKQIIRF